MTPTLLPPSMISLTYTLPSTPPHLTHTPVTPPAPNELLIEVRAAAINPVDIQLWGNPVIGFLAGKKEKGIGRDYAGRIVAVAEASKGKGWEEGVEVFGLMNRPVSQELSFHCFGFVSSSGIFVSTTGS
jgi:NADPH:quinone reductase-like Zn-dependent oxidoreductase